MNRIHRPSPTLSNQSVLSQSIHPSNRPTYPAHPFSLYIFMDLYVFISKKIYQQPHAPLHLLASKKKTTTCNLCKSPTLT